VPDLLPRRRIVIASATTLPLLLAATGCRSEQAFAGPDPLAGPPPPSPEVITLESVIAAEASLIQAYKTAISGDPPATARPGDLAILLTQHEQHLAQLRARLVLPPVTRAAAGQDRTPAAITAAPARVTVARLRATERGSAARLVRQLTTVEPALAQLFASIAACHATHVAALGG
jgi:hypothetical protein